MNRMKGLCGTTSIVALLLGAAPAFAQVNQNAVPEQDAQTEDSPTVAADPPGDDIVVTGIRRSLESAAAIKRNSDGIVDAIVAEDIGKLPDTFASSALQRVTGVQVTRGGGEAAGVQVRGLPDISTTYNGREIFTAEGRFVQIQDFPAGTVAALEVYKSGTANLIEGGIGGQVNVRGRKPFDFAGFEVSGSLNGVNWEQSGDLTWNGNLLISNRWDTGIGEIGVLVNASYVGLKFLEFDPRAIAGHRHNQCNQRAGHHRRRPLSRRPGAVYGLWRTLAPVGQRGYPVEAEPRTRNLRGWPISRFP